ncbi:UNVERIFIED_CONTAM: hypothetical protein Sindi_1435400 [Sesamum indicum]
MAMFLFLSFSTPLSSRFLPTTPKPLRTSTRFQISNSKIIPARDRVIDLGKYKGKMLGSLPLSERFGWDNEDKEGWRKNEFGLLGTSKGGRIPRVGAGVEVGSVKKKEKKMVVEGEEERNINGEGEGEERADGGSGKGSASENRRL